MNFQILGPLRVTAGDGTELVLGGPKPAAVLALLLLQPNEVVPAERLIEELWDGQPPATAAKSLQVHISRLRRALADNGTQPLRTHGGGYVLDAQPDEIDAIRFEHAVTEGCTALADGEHALAAGRLRSALAMWRGEALADFTYASFAQEPIARLDGVRTVAFEGAIEAELALGRHAELIPELKSLVRRNPLSERLRGQLMLALYRAGRQAEALGVYRAGRRILVDQLGIEPGAELRDLERAILSQDPQLAAPDPERGRRRERPANAPGGLLVGYEEELRALEELLERALVGQGRAALLSGEPGVGKTRLADELARVAEARGAQVFWARCWDGAGAPAFWPWTQVLRELGHDLPATAEGDAQDARFALFDEVATVVRRTAVARPTVLVFDDLHAADPSTLSLLSFVATAALANPLLIVGTYRDTEVGEALSAALTDLTRTNDCLQLVLTGLTGADTAHFVELSSGIAPMTGLSAAIHQISAGNPLFVSELVRLLQADGRLEELGEGDPLLLPRGIEQVIARRLQHLTEPCRRTLALSSVIGHEIEPPLLQRVAEVSGEELLAQLEEAEEARVLDREGQTLRFSHDLVRQTLYVQLPGRERRKAHAAVAAALEALSAGDPEPALPRLAHHFTEAVPVADAETAVRYLTRAGDAAAERLAYEDASSLYGRAIEVANDNGVDRVAELNVKLAEQFIRLGDGPGATASVDRARAAAGPSPDPALYGRIVIADAQIDLFNACVVGRERIEEVIAMYQKLGDAAGEARAWQALVTYAHGHSCATDEGVAAEQMLVVAREAGSKALVDLAVRGIGSALARGYVRPTEAEPRIRALFADAHAPLTKARLYLYLAEVEGRRGSFEEMRARLADGAAAAIGVEDEWDMCAAVPLAHMEMLAGNARKAEAIMRTSCDDLVRRGLWTYLTTEVVYLAEALVAQGRLDEADATLKQGEAVVVPTDIDALHGQARARASIHLARGEMAEAEGCARRALEIGARMQHPDALIQTRLLLAQILAATGRHDESRELATLALAESDAIEHAVYSHRAREFLAADELVSAG